MHAWQLLAIPLHTPRTALTSSCMRAQVADVGACLNEFADARLEESPADIRWRQYDQLLQFYLTSFGLIYDRDFIGGWRLSDT